jgi:transposase InsO family protein
MLYMIAVLDDCTRFIIHSEVHVDKRSETAAQALINALTAHPPHCVVVSDNGREFVGDAFQRVLQDFKIRF